MGRIIDYNDLNIIGNNVKRYRLERHLSQKDLAEKLEMYAVYICRGSISRIEQHERTVTDFELRAISSVLGVSVTDLFEK